MFKNQNISGVAGWLALLIVALAILGPLQGYGSLINEFDRAIDQYPQLASNVPWQNYRKISWAIFFVSMGLSVIAG